MNEAPSPETASPSATPRDVFFSTIASLIRAVNDGAQGGLLSSGDVASLRREDGARSPTFYKVAALLLGPQLDDLRGEYREEAERRWARVVHLIARSAAQLALKGNSLGRALAQAELSEARFVRLLRVEGDSIDSAARAALAPVQQKAVPFDPRDLAAIVLSAPHPHWRFHFEDGDPVRRRVARDYYRALNSAESNKA